MVAVGLLTALILMPISASASVFNFGARTAQADTVPQKGPIGGKNSQTMALVSASIGPDALSKDASPSADEGIDKAALMPSMGPAVGNGTEQATSSPDLSGQISVYTVREGDTLSSVAAMFNVTKATIAASNNLKSNASLKVGSEITVLPISGHEYTVRENDTLKSIALKYKGVEASDIAYANGMGIDDELSTGDTLVIPDDNFEIAVTPIPTTKPTKNPIKSGGIKNTSGNSVKSVDFTYNSGTPDLGNYWLRPIKGGVLTQGLHGARHTGIDIGAPIGTPIYAAATGTVLIADASGNYNTGYGSYVVINHSINGFKAQTLYAHMSRVVAVSGETVQKGQLIGYVGVSGRVTGAHLHFEVNGAKNPFANDPNYGL
jgi:murein DD-endopeptidase MepM/ murein hydrolase activator NlpD